MNNSLDLGIIKDLDFFVKKRDVGSESREEFIEDALNTSIPLERLSYYSWNDRDLIKEIRNRNEIIFTYFEDSNSPFSQNHKVSIISVDLFYRGLNEVQMEYLRSSFLTEIEFSSAEQFMQYHKAILFLDRKTASKIIQTSDYNSIRQLGNQIENFKEDIWCYHRSNVVYQGNKLKFEQNLNLLEILSETVGTTLVNATAGEKLWGIGLNMNDPKSLQRNTWAGKNLLGEILTLLRIEFTGMY